MKKYTNEELQEILRLHKMWLNNEPGGKRADLRGSNLRGSNLSGSNLSDSDLRDSDLRDSNLRHSNLSGSNLRGSNLSGSNLSDSNLRGAELDYSCLPLWCGSLSAHFDDRQLKQIAYHLVNAGLQSKNASAETKRELSKLIDFANGFHRVGECGKIVFKEGDTP